MIKFTTLITIRIKTLTSSSHLCTSLSCIRNCSTLTLMCEGFTSKRWRITSISTSLTLTLSYSTTLTSSYSTTLGSIRICSSISIRICSSISIYSIRCIYWSIRICSSISIYSIRCIYWSIAIRIYWSISIKISSSWLSAYILRLRFSIRSIRTLLN